MSLGEILEALTILLQFSMLVTLFYSLNKCGTKEEDITSSADSFLQMKEQILKQGPRCNYSILVRIVKEEIFYLSTHQRFVSPMDQKFVDIHLQPKSIISI